MNLYQFSFKCLILIRFFWDKHAIVPIFLTQFEDVRIDKFTHLIMDLLCSQGNVISCKKLLVFVIVYSTVLDWTDFVDLWLGLKFESSFCLLYRILKLNFTKMNVIRYLIFESFLVGCLDKHGKLEIPGSYIMKSSLFISNPIKKTYCFF